MKQNLDLVMSENIKGEVDNAKYKKPDSTYFDKLEETECCF